jgi:hypothetical protein
MELQDKFNMVLETDQSGAKLRVMKVSGTFSAPNPATDHLNDLLSKVVNTDQQKLQIIS